MSVILHVNVAQSCKLSPGQTIATCQRNISQHCWAQHVTCVWPPCCDMLRHVRCCWVNFDHFQIWTNNTQHVATCRNTVAKRTQHVAPNNVAICCVGMLRSFGRCFRVLFSVKPRPNDSNISTQHIATLLAQYCKPRPNDRNIWTQQIATLLGATLPDFKP